MRPRLLDLYSCAGGAARGYLAAGFDVTCVDIDPQPRNPFPFIQADVLTLDPEWIATFDAVHSSPPCQKYTRLRHRYVTNGHPDLIGPTRDLLEAAGRPYVIENVEDARPLLRDPIVLCGLMFPPLRVIRHRYFETGGSLVLTQPAHPPCRRVRCHTLDKRKKHYGHTNEWTDFVQVTGGGNCTVAAAADAMLIAPGVMTKRELNEAIPPPYAHWIGAALIAHLKEAAA